MTWHLKDGNPCVSNVVERHRVLERIAVGGATRRVVAIPVDTRLIDVDVGGRPVGHGRRRVAARAVEHERQQVDALGHSVVVRHAADEVQATLAIERRQSHASTQPQMT